jgi:hypothetical protein
LKFRRLNEETAQMNAQAAAITLAAMKSLTSQGEKQINISAGSLKTLAISSVIKVFNIHDRQEDLTPEIYEDLFEDMEQEFCKVPHLKRIKVIRGGEEKLGAEVGSVFVEFRDKKSAEIALKLIKKRVYDGREVRCVFVDEGLYYSQLQIP